MQKIQLSYLILLITLASCGDNIPKQKDRFPDIPDFPEFKAGVLKSKKIDSVQLKLNKDFKRQSNDYYFNYLVRDSSLYIVTYFSDREFPKIPLDANYFVDLVIINNDQPVKHFRWKVNDFDINFDVDPDHNVIIGKRKYLAKTDYAGYEGIKRPNMGSSEKPAIFKEWFSPGEGETEESDDFKSFDRVIIDSEGQISKRYSSGWGYHHSAVYLIYYKLKYKKKEGLTKINYTLQNAPLFLKLNEEIYYVEYSEDFSNADNRIKKYIIYKIGN